MVCWNLGAGEGTYGNLNGGMLPVPDAVCGNRTPSLENGFLTTILSLTFIPKEMTE